MPQVVSSIFRPALSSNWAASSDVPLAAGLEDAAASGRSEAAGANLEPWSGDVAGFSREVLAMNAPKWRCLSPLSFLIFNPCHLDPYRGMAGHSLPPRPGRFEGIPHFKIFLRRLQSHDSLVKAMFWMTRSPCGLVKCNLLPCLELYLCW